MQDIKSLAEYLRQQGGDEDTVLAHINPQEAQMLQDMGGSGEINEVTGLPQYGLFGKGGLGAVLGAVAGSFVGAPTIGASIGAGIGGSVSGKRKKSKRDVSGIEYEYGDEDSEPGFLSKLGSKSSDFFSDPMNLLSVGSAAASDMSRPKKERKLSPEERGDEYLREMMASRMSPEQLAALKKRAMRANRLTPEEIREEMMYQQALERAKWEAQNNLAPGETLNFDPAYRKENDEDEFKKTGRWFEYYNDPEFKGKRVYMAQDGHIANPKNSFMEIEIKAEPEHDHGVSLSNILNSLLDYNNDDNFYSGYIDGEDGGQDDTVEARLSPGEYVIDAETVAHLGDGNSKNGAKKLDEFIKRVREHKRSSDYDTIAPGMLEYRN